MKTMTIINACIHLLVLIALVVMYYRLFNTQTPGKSKKMQASWWLLKALLIFTIGMHFWYALGAIGSAKTPPNWMNVVAYIGTIAALFWAQKAHKWNNMKELSKELKHLTKRKTLHV
jgi:cation transport ATPase